MSWIALRGIPYCCVSNILLLFTTHISFINQRRYVVFATDSVVKQNIPNSLSLSTWRHIPEVWNVQQQQQCENVKSHMIMDIKVITTHLQGFSSPLQRPCSYNSHRIRISTHESIIYLIPFIRTSLGKECWVPSGPCPSLFQNNITRESVLHCSLFQDVILFGHIETYFAIILFKNLGMED